MDFPFQNCIVPAENFAAPLIRELLEFHHGMTYMLLDLKKFEGEMQKLTEDKIVTRYLSSKEQVCFSKFTSGKRKREWLGGRFAAKYVAAGMLAQNGNALAWSDPAVLAQESGRPFLAAAQKNGAVPDISISHSGDLAAAMAVSKGLCGIDIQKVTDRVVKVRQRFCSPDEEDIARSFSSAPQEKKSFVLTKLWAAKEALRKVANMDSLPGFLELQLAEINAGSSEKDSAPWRFIFMWKRIDMNANPYTEKCSVVVGLVADYALALTTRNDTVG